MTDTAAGAIARPGASGAAGEAHPRERGQGVISLFDMLSPPEPVEDDPGPRWTRLDSRAWEAAARFMRQHPELCEPAEDYRDYLPYWEPERTHTYYDWG
jgi:hypothetical protein